MRRLILALAALAALTALPLGCTPEEYADERTVKLDFSADTVSFDTVFTTMGTATRQLKVYNRSTHDIELSSVTLKHGRHSRFRLNVDGDTSMVARHVELQGGDSIFIFIEACIDPNESTAPFLRTDSIVFGNGQCVPLQAYGRNAVYHRLAPGDSSWFCRIDCAAWDNSRPHVFLSPAAVMEGNTLTLRAGDELYFGDGAMLIIDSAATLDARGTAERPILFTSLRQEEWYRHLPGQWLFIWLYNFSTGNVIDHAVIENGTAGLRCYPGSQATVSNTVVRQMSDAGLVGQNATASVHNMLVYDCYSALALIGGGEYSFSQSTFADYWNYIGKSRDTAAVIISNHYYLPDGSYTGADMRRADFTNCIVYGNHRNEVAVSTRPPFAMSYSFTRCLVRGGEWDADPLFTSVENDDYSLQEDSPAAGIGYQP